MVSKMKSKIISITYLQIHFIAINDPLDQLKPKTKTKN
jgi:hypothetical protein